ncbi:MAG: phosphate ABC transporter substrate-binding protein PstS [Acidobacteriia bacterium]|nr:phosphate ABC transporter substrate-binding protein PstS [Terriglobia bacterium]
MKKTLLLSVAVFLSLAALPRLGSAQEAVVLVGSGSSVPAPLYAKWTDAYNKRKPGFQMRYLPIGTSEGIKQISHGVGDFGAGEVALTAKERSEENLLELPSVLIGIVPIYHLPGTQKELRFSGELLAEIFLGTVKTWNAPQIAKLNPGVSLPDLPIKVIYRPGGKGTNYVFSEFLSKTSPKFHAEIGISPSPRWPVGVPAERSSDMADKVKSEPGSIGFVEAQYAIKAGIPFGLVLNPAGHFVKASSETITNACRAVEAPSWDKFAASLTNAPGADSFPITSFTWLYLRTSSPDARRAAALADFLNWVYSDGQQLALQEGYSDLPSQLLAKVKAKVASLH